jgi:hypothetical protein
VAHSPSLAFLLGMQGTGWGWAASKHYATLFVTPFFYCMNGTKLFAVLRSLPKLYMASADFFA